MSGWRGRLARGGASRWPGRFATVLVGAAVALCSPSGCGRAETTDGGEVSAIAAAENEQPASRSPSSTTGSKGTPSSLLGEGFVVWESNRRGGWRIWTRRLDGSGLRRLTPNEPGRHHCCPHISPDGRWVTYLSTSDGGPKYDRQGTPGALYLISMTDDENRLLGESARSYFENRAVVWLDSRSLVYINGAGDTVELDTKSGEEKRWLQGKEGERGWLLNATLSHATSGQATFSIFDRKRRTLAIRAGMGGCQPYFSHDGRWGFWVAGAGGPMNRFDLSTRQASVILERNDPRMVEGWGYAYFPMLSADGRLFAYAASQDQHDHFKRDYEVFVVETDPGTLEALGPARRITHHPATDRYPDVHLAPLALGRRYGEAPMTVRLEPDPPQQQTPGGDGWVWDFGDGATAGGVVGEHTYERAGRFEVIARRGESLLRGQVALSEPRPPTAVEAALVEEGRRILIRFDEEVALERAKVELESGHPVGGWSPGEDGRSLVVELTEPLKRPDHVSLTGVVDRAQVPNRLTGGGIEVSPPLWPSRRAGLAFLWETGQAPNLVPDPELGADRSFTLRARGLARLDGHGAMLLAGGAFELDPADQSGHVSRALQGKNSLSLEVTVTPEEIMSDRRNSDTVVAFAGAGRGQNFRLLQRGGHLTFSMKIGGRPGVGNPELELFRIPVGRPSHVVVTFTPGRFAAYLDGELKVDKEVLGDFFHWRAYPLVFGGEHGGGRDWEGRLEGVAIYDRVLEPSEVRENFLRNRTRLERRK